MAEALLITMGQEARPLLRAVDSPAAEDDDPMSKETANANAAAIKGMLGGLPGGTGGRVSG